MNGSFTRDTSNKGGIDGSETSYQISQDCSGPDILAMGTLDLKDPNMDGVLDIYDLGVVITNLISRLSEKSDRQV